MTRLYTLGELDTKRAGQPWWNGWSQAFDEARFETFSYDDENVNDMTEDDYKYIQWQHDRNPSEEAKAAIAGGADPGEVFRYRPRRFRQATRPQLYRAQRQQTRRRWPRGWRTR